MKLYVCIMLSGHSSIFPDRTGFVGNHYGKREISGREPWM